MTEYFPKSAIQIPIKLVDGQWEFFYGGKLPIKNGAIGNLSIDKHNITDKTFIAMLTQKYVHKILDEGVELLVALTIKTPFEKPLSNYMIPFNEHKEMLSSEFYHSIRSSQTRFVKVTISAPIKPQTSLLPDDTGGVWLYLQGHKPKGIVTSSVKVPDEVSKEPLDSLNYAFTRLSEVYEPWRKSHTGNIYERFLYKEKNNIWYPLDVLRNAEIAKEEHQLICEQWTLLSNKLKLNQVI
jgi:hypothetical protein